MSSGPAICTWLVEDDHSSATFYPQIGLRSDSAAAKAAYWRCVACFFASSRLQNPGHRHILFTNAAPPIISGLPLDRLLKWLNVEVVHLDIEHRLPAGRVTVWGNQFYIIDIIHFIRGCSDASSYLIFDTDCLWRHPADDLARTVEEHGVVTYLLGEDEHPEGSKINGRSREDLAAFASRVAKSPIQRVDYSGGELFAANKASIARIGATLDDLWPWVMSGGDDAPLEEAHLLSVIYALHKAELGGANPFLRRIWTGFSYRNVRPDDDDRAVWHLPSEKRTGFRVLFDLAATRANGDPERFFNAFSEAKYHHLMGIPTRGLGKLASDITTKLSHRLGNW